MLDAFLEYIKKNKLLSSVTTLIGVSGGRDSVVLCDLYHRAGLPFAIAHCNFNLRGEESDADEAFVERLAADYGVRLHSKSCLTKVYASEKGISIQMAARELRFDWFRQLLQENIYEYYATAHHQDDAIETYLINQIRGTGIAGLHGILPKTGTLIHPLLFASRADIDQYIQELGLTYRDDSSNASTKYIRNKIRHDLMPVLLDINPQIQEVFLGNMRRMNAIEKVFNIKIEEYRKELVTTDGDRVSIRLSADDDGFSAVLYELIKEYGFNFSQLTQLLEAFDKQESGAVFYSQSHRMLLDRKRLIIDAKKDESNEVISIHKNTKKIDFPFVMSFETSNDLKIISDKKIAQLDDSKLVYPLVVRKWKKGDFFYPLGMKGKKLLSDFFIDQKLSVFEKEEVYLLCSAKDVVWVIGYRMDDRYKLTKHSESVLKIRVN